MDHSCASLICSDLRRSGVRDRVQVDPALVFAYTTAVGQRTSAAALWIGKTWVF